MTPAEGFSDAYLRVVKNAKQNGMYTAPDGTKCEVLNVAEVDDYIVALHCKEVKDPSVTRDFVGNISNFVFEF